jgi:predicted nucleotidyltransferase
MAGLYWNTVGGLLRDTLESLMKASEFEAFRLVGGTSLSLQLGHRISIDLDLFTDAPYGTVDFEAIDQFFVGKFPYACTNGGQVGLGTSYFAGNNEQDAVKIDLYYTDEFINPFLVIDGIRMATIQEIIAMKLEVISGKGRKKDFWDIHALISDYSFKEMLHMYSQRYPYSDQEEQIKLNMVAFDKADYDFDPICMHGKSWELIKYDIRAWAR